MAVNQQHQLTALQGLVATLQAQVLAVQSNHMMQKCTRNSLTTELYHIILLCPVIIIYLFSMLPMIFSEISSCCCVFHDLRLLRHLQVLPRCCHHPRKKKFKSPQSLREPVREMCIAALPSQPPSEQVDQAILHPVINEPPQELEPSQNSPQAPSLFAGVSSRGRVRNIAQPRADSIEQQGITVAPSMIKAERITLSMSLRDVLPTMFLLKLICHCAYLPTAIIRCLFDLLHIVSIELLNQTKGHQTRLHEKVYPVKRRRICKPKHRSTKIQSLRHRIGIATQVFLVFTRFTINVGCCAGLTLQKFNYHSSTIMQASASASASSSASAFCPQATWHDLSPLTPDSDKFIADENLLPPDDYSRQPSEGVSADDDIVRHDNLSSEGVSANDSDVQTINEHPQEFEPSQYSPSASYLFVSSRGRMFTELIVTSMFGRSNQSLLNDDFQFVVKLIPTLNSEGARAPLSKLIAGCGYSEISFYFCEDCRIFREGVKDSTIGIVSNKSPIGLVGRINYNGLNGLVGRIVQNGLVDRNDLVDHNGIVGRNYSVDHIGLDLLGHNGLNGVIDLGVSFFGFVGFIGLGLVKNGIVGRNGLNIGFVGQADLVLSIVIPFGLTGIGLIGCNGLVLGFIGFSVSFIGLGIVGFVGLSLVSLGRFIGGLIGHFGLVGRCIIGLIELSDSSNHWPLGLIGVISLGLIASPASTASLARWLISFVGLIGLIVISLDSLFDCIGLNGHIGRNGFIGRIGLVNSTYLFNVLVGNIKFFKLSELIVKHPMGLIFGFIGLVGHDGLIGRIVRKVHSKLVAQIIGVLNSEGARDPSTTFPMLHNRKIELIVASHFSKTFFHFSKGFATLCEGDRESANNGNDAEDDESNLPSLLPLASAISTQGALNASDPTNTLAATASLILLFLIGLVGIGLFGPTNIARHTVPNSFDDHIGLVDLMKPIGLVGRICPASLICFVGLIGLTNPAVFIYLIGLNSLVDSVGIIDLDGIIGLINCNFGLIGRNDLADHIGLNLFGHNGLNGFIGLGVSFIGLGFVGFIGLGLVSISGFVGQISLVGLKGLISLGETSITSLVGSSAFDGFIGHILDLVVLLELIKLTVLVKLVSLFSLFNCIGLNSHIGRNGFVGRIGLVGRIKLIKITSFVSLVGLIRQICHNGLFFFSLDGHTCLVGLFINADYSVSWASKLQSQVALYTTKAEYIAMSQALRDIIPIMGLLQEMRERGFKVLCTDPYVYCKVFEDNSGALELARLPKLRPRTKHINVCYHHFFVNMCERDSSRSSLSKPRIKLPMLSSNLWHKMFFIVIVALCAASHLHKQPK